MRVQHSSHNNSLEENVALRAEAAQYREQHAEIYARYEKLSEEMKKKKIDSFEALA